MQADPPSCAVQYFVRTAALAMHPVLEEYMAAFLMHHVVPVKQAAARSLGRYGSPAALGPLWDAFRYFHDYWEGKGESNLDGVELEVELRNAIARGRNWLADEADLRLMQSLCVTRRCLNETWRDLGAWQGAPRIEIYEQPPGIRGAVAQYWGIETVAELKAKLSQFPRGTQFVLRASGPEAREAAAEIRSFAGEHGLVITDAAPARGQRGQPR